MPANASRQRFKNEDLVLRVNSNVKREVWDEDPYEAFIDELCGDREYQKHAIRTALRYLLGGEYRSLRALAQSKLRKTIQFWRLVMVPGPEWSAISSFQTSFPHRLTLRREPARATCSTGLQQFY